MRHGWKGLESINAMGGPPSALLAPLIATAAPQRRHKCCEFVTCGSEL
jgi:hypothetical protein